MIELRVQKKGFPDAGWFHVAVSKHSPAPPAINQSGQGGLSEFSRGMEGHSFRSTYQDVKFRSTFGVKGASDKIND